MRTYCLSPHPPGPLVEHLRRHIDRYMGAALEFKRHNCK